MNKAAIIIPFRDSFKNGERYLQLFTLYTSITNICEKYQQDYEVVIIHQHGDGPFNKAYLMNIGVDLVKAETDYFIINDVDHISIGQDNVYRRRDISGALVRKQNDILYEGDGFWGGAVYLCKEDYFKINGFCNYFWGWGFEDGAIRERLKHAEIPIKRHDGVFKTLIHETRHRYMGSPNFINNAIVYNLINVVNKANDGYNTINYKVLSTLSMSDKVKFYNVRIPDPQYDVNSFLTNKQVHDIIKTDFDQAVIDRLIKNYKK